MGSIYQKAHLSIHPFSQLFLHLSTHPSTFFLSLYTSFSPSFPPSSIHLSISSCSHSYNYSSIYPSTNNPFLLLFLPSIHPYCFPSFLSFIYPSFPPPTYHQYITLPIHLSILLIHPSTHFFSPLSLLSLFPPIKTCSFNFPPQPCQAHLCTLDLKHC